MVRDQPRPQKFGSAKLCSLSETELTRHCQKVRPNRIFGRSLLDIKHRAQLTSSSRDELAQQQSYNNRKVLLYTVYWLTLILLIALSDVIRHFFSEVRRDGQNTSTISELPLSCKRRTVYTTGWAKSQVPFSPGRKYAFYPIVWFQ